MELADLICDAVKKRRVIELDSLRDPEGETRVVEPHAVYIGSNSRGFVDFYQRSGYSSSGKLPGWRRFALTDIETARPLDLDFTPRTDYHPNNRQWYRAFVCTSESQDEPRRTDDLIGEVPITREAIDEQHPAS